MEASKLLIASIAISLVFVGVWADAGAEEEAVVVEPDVSDSVLKLELEQLRSKISALGQREFQFDLGLKLGFDLIRRLLGFGKYKRMFLLPFVCWLEVKIYL